MTGFIYVLVAQDEDGYINRINTAEHTPAGKESLEKQAARLPRAWVQTEKRGKA